MKLPSSLHNFLVKYIVDYVDQIDFRNYTKKYDLRLKYDSYVSADTKYTNGIEAYITKVESDGEIIKLIEGLNKEIGSDSDYKTFYDEALKKFIKTSEGKWKWSRDAFEYPLLKNRLPFIGRAEVSKAIERLVNREIEDVVVMDGQKGSGLSYIKYYLSHIAEQHECFKFVYVNIRDMGKVYPKELISAVHVAEFLSQEIHLEFSPQEFKLHPFVTRLKGFFDSKENGEQTYLIYFDQFDDPIGKDVKELVAELAEKAIVNNARSYIIIADFDQYENWPFEIQSIVEYIDIAKGSFTETQINEFLEKLYVNNSAALEPKISKLNFIASGKEKLTPELFEESEEPNVTKIGRSLTSWYKGIQKIYGV